MRATDAKAKRKWIAAMRNAINAQESTKVVHTEDTLHARGISILDLM